MSASKSARDSRRNDRAGRRARFAAEVDARRALAIGVIAAIAVGALAAIAGPHFAERWRIDSPTRVAGHDTVVTERAATALRRATAEGEIPGRERRELLAKAQAVALRGNPFSPLLWREAGSLLYRLGHAEKGRAMLDIARRIDPLNPAVRYQIGNELLLREGPTSALGDYREAMRVDFEGAGSAHFILWRMGFDPVRLLRALVPRRHLARRAYFRDAIGRVSPGNEDRIWEAVRGDWDLDDEQDREVVAAYLGALHRRVRLGDARTPEGKKAALEMLHRARKQRLSVLGLAYDVAAAPDGDWMTPAGSPPESGLFNPSGSLPRRSLGLGDWQWPGEDIGQTAEFVESLPDHWPGARASGGGANPNAGRWLHVTFDDLSGRAVQLPAQTMLLDGATSYSLEYDVATRGLFTALPLHLEVVSWGRDPLGRVAARSRRGPPITGEQPPGVASVDFQVLREGEGPQLLRLVRATGGQFDPALKGEIWLRFRGIESAPLPEGYVAREVGTEEFLRAIDASAPSLLDSLEP